LIGILKNKTTAVYLLSKALALMNRYPLWKYITVLVALVLGLLYTLPNFFGESPAVQVSSAKVTLKIEPAMLDQIATILKQANIEFTASNFETSGPVGTVRFRFKTTDQQIIARDVIEKALNPNPNNPSYTVALNLLPASPAWLSALGANPMYLGLDLRGGVHFLLEVDMKGALTSRYDAMITDFSAALRDQNIASDRIERVGNSVVLKFSDDNKREAALSALRKRFVDLQWQQSAPEAASWGPGKLM
jgi:preprotein translocase subunit SecD